jgi:murein L,D-transpeptidase YcbB/YkuD
MNRILSIVGICLAVAVGCERREKALDASALAIQSVIAKPLPGVRREVAAAVTAFYTQRQFAPAWHDRRGRPAGAPNALEILRQAEDHGLERDTYREGDLTREVATRAASKSSKSEGEPDATAIADLDVRLTAAVVQLGSHVATGRLDPAKQPKPHRDAPDLAAVLQTALNDSAMTFLDRVRPVHPEYQALQKGLHSLRGQAQVGWPDVPKKTLRPGQLSPVVAVLRKRLAAEGYLDAAHANDSPRFDDDVAAALGRFQEHHALKASGILDAATLEAMSVPLDARIAQVAINLERWRWMPDDLGERHFLVNIPYYHLVAREHGKPVLDIRVVVGKPGNETPTFSDEMTEVVFSPYWNIPETIALEETAPAVLRDPNYLARNNMEVINASGRVMSPADVPWDDEQALRGLSFRQRPGANNALGFVKFLFPNRYNVYIHDTPADALFSRIGRAFSHGCIRVEEPETLAQYVLRDRSEWTPDAILTAMRAGEERHVKLNSPIPVHIVYLTSWVDDAGGLHFQPDIYGYDRGDGNPAANVAVRP